MRNGAVCGVGAMLLCLGCQQGSDSAPAPVGAAAFEAELMAADRAFDDMAGRVRGAFCFADPNGFHSYNADLTGAAIQGLAAAWAHSITPAAEIGRAHV